MMKRKDVVFGKNAVGQDFLRDCLFNKWQGQEYIETVFRLVRKAKDTEGLIDMILDCEELKYSQAYAEISKRKRPAEHWKRIREMFGERQFKTWSEAGGLRVGTDSFSIIIPNGRGDGETRVAIFEKGDKFNDNMMQFFTKIEGNSIQIYGNDCGIDVVKKLEGSYLVYYYDGFIALKETERND